MSSGIQDIAIVGAGGLGKEIAVLIGQINQVQKIWNLVGFFDDGLPAGSEVLSLPVLGNIDALNRGKRNSVIAIGNPALKAAIVKRLTNPHLKFPVLVHPSASLGQEITVGEGSIVCAGSVLTVHINIGRHVLINLNTTIGHDVVVGDYSSLMPGTHVSGFVTVGQRAFIGTGTSILQNVQLEEGAVVGAGAVVNRDVKANVTVVGVPAREIPRQS
jgi:sugar O-acyltransferase (sialic acid O-acetyltransferase NeuD family)